MRRQKCSLSKKILLITLLLCGSNQIFAGWFICYCYKGVIGKDSVLFNIQIERRYSTTKGDWLGVDGVYMLTKQRKPIPLLGKFNSKTKKIELEELNGGKETISFNIDFSEKVIVGKRIKKNRSETEIVKLHQVANLIDTIYDSEIQISGVEILQDTSLPKYLLIGIYSIDPLRDAKMTALKLVDKITNKIFQIIDLSPIDFPTGNLVTNIFKNVEVKRSYKNAGNDDLVIWCRVGKRGGSYYAYYDPVLRKYELNLEAVKYDYKPK